MVGIFYSMPFFNYILPDRPVLSIVWIFNVLFIIGIPLLSIALLIVRLAFKRRVHTYWKTFMGIVLGLNVISFIFILTLVLRGFSTGSTLEHRETLSANLEQPIQISMQQDPYEHAIFHIGPDLKMTEDVLVSSMLSLDFKKSPDSTCFIQKESFSRGSTIREADQLAGGIDYEVEFNDNELQFPRNFLIEQGEKFRGQQIKLSLYVPLGTKIKIDQSMDPILWHYLWNKRKYIWPELPEDTYGHWDLWNKTLEMTEDGLKCIDCELPQEKEDLSETEQDSMQTETAEEKDTIQ